MTTNESIGDLEQEVILPLKVMTLRITFVCNRVAIISNWAEGKRHCSSCTEDQDTCVWVGITWASRCGPLFEL